METPPDTPQPPKAGELVKPKHGKGLLRHGSTKETAVAGPGRPASAIRDKLRGSFEDRLGVLESIADSVETSAADRMKALDLMGKYGLGSLKAINEDDVRARVREQMELILAKYPPDLANEILDTIEPVWKKA